MDFGAPGIPVWTGFIFPLPLPEVVPLEKEFRRKNPQVSVLMISSQFLRAGINGRSGDGPEPTARREGGRGIDGSSFVTNQKPGIIGFPASGEINQGIHHPGQGHSCCRTTWAWENLLGIGGKPSGGFQTETLRLSLMELMIFPFFPIPSLWVSC